MAIRPFRPARCAAAAYPTGSRVPSGLVIRKNLSRRGAYRPRLFIQLKLKPDLAELDRIIIEWASALGTVSVR